jgi:VanZ family protein
MSFRKHAFRHPALWHVTGWGLIAVIVYLSLAHTSIGVPGQYGDKYGHVIAYGAVMFWFLQIYECTPSRITAAASLIALGVGLEFLQGWSGYRTFDYADMIADCIGVGLGWIAAPPRTPHVLERIEKAAPT